MQDRQSGGALRLARLAALPVLTILLTLAGSPARAGGPTYVSLPPPDPETGILEIRATTPEGTPVAEAHVVVEWRTPGVSSPTLGARGDTGETGFYQAELPVGIWLVEARANGHLPATSLGDLRITLESDALEARLEAPPDGWAPVSGRVVREAMGVADTYVWFSPRGPHSDHAFEIHPDDDGGFAFPWLPVGDRPAFDRLRGRLATGSPVDGDAGSFGAPVHPDRRRGRGAGDRLRELSAVR